MTIKHVVLDVYNLVHERNPKFTKALIQLIADTTKYPWEESAYAVSEAVNHFRSLDSDGAFICDSRDFVSDIMARLDLSVVDPATLAIDMIYLSDMYRPKTTTESQDAVQYLHTNEVFVTFAANTNMLPASVIAHQLIDKFPAGQINLGLLNTSDEHLQMPHDAVWLQAIKTAKLTHPAVTYGNSLFVTTNSKFAFSAERAGLQVAVISGPDELLLALKRRIDDTLKSEGNDNAILG